MEKTDFNELINKAKASSNSNNRATQKVVPLISKKADEVQFSFYIKKVLLKKLKLILKLAYQKHLENLRYNYLKKSKVSHWL